MTEYTIKTTRKEADQIENGIKAFVFRSDRKPYRVGDVVNFRVIEKMKPVRHTIENKAYIVTYASDDEPIADGFSIIGLRRI